MSGVTWPRLPASNTQQAAEAINQVVVERNYPTSPHACARVGYEACFRIAERQRVLVAAVQAVDEHQGLWAEVRDQLQRVRELTTRSPGPLPEPTRAQVAECLERLNKLLPIGPELPLGLPGPSK